VHQQPLGTFEVIVSHGVTQHIVERVQRNNATNARRLRNFTPTLEQSSSLGLGPKDVEPGCVVSSDRGVVQRLSVEGICTTLDQQRRKLRGMDMRRDIAFAFTNDSGQDCEWILPVIDPACVGVGTMIQQQDCDGERLFMVARQSRVRKIEQRLPIERSASLSRGRGIEGEPSFDLAQVPVATAA